MSITYHVKSNVFQLDGKDVTYLIGNIAVMGV